jgi:hypothetical protein
MGNNSLNRISQGCEKKGVIQGDVFFDKKPKGKMTANHSMRN